MCMFSDKLLAHDLYWLPQSDSYWRITYIGYLKVTATGASPILVTSK